MYAGYALLSFLLTALLTAVAVAYAHRRGLLDLPGARRSHSVPTPRGGGIGIVVVMAAAIVLSLQAPWGTAVPAAVFLLCIGLIAGIGWWDDHRPLSAGLRLGVHLVVAVAWIVASGWPTAPGAVGWILLSLSVVFVAGMINAWNFMDGINGLASSQALIVALALGWLHARAGQPGQAWLCLVLASSCAGFLPFNLPRARIFLGDVGSGALGFMIAALLIVAWQQSALPLASALVLPSAFVLDSGLTLAMRILAGKRWYRPHREHLYQWLVRSGRTHAQVTLGYAMWTSACVLLVAATPAGGGPVTGAAGLLAVYGLGAWVWWRLRRRLLQRARGRAD